MSRADTGNAQVYWTPGTGTGTATGNGQVSQFIDLLPSVQIPLSALSSLLAAENGVRFIKPARWALNRSLCGNCIIIGDPAEDKRRN